MTIKVAPVDRFISEEGTPTGVIVSENGQQHVCLYL